MFLVHTDATVISGQQENTVRLILMNAKTRASVTSRQVTLSAITTMQCQITLVTILSGKDTVVFAVFKVK